MSATIVINEEWKYTFLYLDLAEINSNSYEIIIPKSQGILNKS